MIESLHGMRETVNFRSSSIVRFYRNETDEDYPPHWHLPGEIIAPLVNTYEVTVADQTLSLSPGDVLVIASSELHSIKAPRTGVRYILDFSTSLFDQLPDLSFILALIQPCCLLTAAAMPQVTAQLVDILRRIEVEHNSDTEVFRDAEICSLLVHFFVLVGRYAVNMEKFQSLAPPKQQEYADRFVSVCDYINSHCTENLTLEQVSEQAGFSKYHFARLFRELTGTTVHNYVTNRRILYAQSLLADEALSVTEVSMRSGFNSLATFNRIFKKQMGCTPSEYRKLNSRYYVEAGEPAEEL